jgi:hypothetical protein
MSRKNKCTVINKSPTGNITEIGKLVFSKGIYTFTYSKIWLNGYRITISPELPVEAIVIKSKDLFLYLEDRIPPMDSSRFKEIMECFDENIFKKYPNMNDIPKIYLLKTIGARGADTLEIID